MGSYKWSYKSPNMGYNYSYLTYYPTYNYPGTSKCCKIADYTFFPRPFLD